MEEIEKRVKIGYTMAVYGTMQAIHDQMLKDIKYLLEHNKALRQPPVSGELADFVQFLDDEYSMKVPERVIDEWEKYYSANYR